jgi:hypothetical protein
MCCMRKVIRCLFTSLLRILVHWSQAGDRPDTSYVLEATWMTTSKARSEWRIPGSVWLCSLPKSDWWHALDFMHILSLCSDACSFSPLGYHLFPYQILLLQKLGSCSVVIIS